MNGTRLTFIILCISIFVKSYGQLENYKHQFVNPLRIEQSLSGNFGEPRSRHFHTGLDYRTWADGKDVVAIADGYVYRVLVSPWGYGMAIYMNHPSGHTSVYGHLSKFTPEIEKFVTDLQYKNHSFAIDTVLPQDMFTFKRGETIAYSGNTGFSEGPHLHFEIRETDTEHPLNPLETVYHIKDDKKPEITKLFVYPLSEKSIVDGSNYRKEYKLEKSNGVYTYKNSIGIGGPVGIGLAYVDRMTGTTNRYGAKTVKLYLDNELIYHSEVSELDFEKQRCKNSVFDYDCYLNDKLHVHKLFVEPNNDLKIFPYLVNDGEFYIPDGSNGHVKIEVYDYAGNVSEVEINLSGRDACYDNIVQSKNLLEWDKSYMLAEEECRVEIDSAVLFTDEKIEFKKVKEGKYSSVYKVGEENIPQKKDFLISFYLDDEFLSLADKMFVVREREGKFRYINPIRSQRYISASSSYFGQFYLWVDTIAPKIKPKNISQNRNMSNNSYIEVEIEDNFSGINQFDMYINDVWVLGQYDPRKHQLRYYFDDKMPKADSYKLNVVVTDNCNNVGIYEVDFRY